jgi:MOSC domain-containing protein YiiM
MSIGRVLSVNLAVPELSTAKRVGITGINKQPVDHPVAVRAPGPKSADRPSAEASGLAGDQIFDVANHGGDDQAVYAYAREDYDWWEQRLDWKLPGGMFGENLTLAGVDVNGAVIGEQWRIGSELVLQPTFGRIPCATFQARMGLPGWLKTFTRENRPGAYLRVVTPGDVTRGDSVEVVDRPSHGVSIAMAFRAYMTEPEMIPGLLEIEDLPSDLRAGLESRIQGR